MLGPALPDRLAPSLRPKVRQDGLDHNQLWPVRLRRAAAGRRRRCLELAAHEQREELDAAELHHMRRNIRWNIRSNVRSNLQLRPVLDARVHGRGALLAARARIYFWRTFSAHADGERRGLVRIRA